MFYSLIMFLVPFDSLGYISIQYISFVQLLLIFSNQKNEVNCDRYNKKQKNKMEKSGIEPKTSYMLSMRSAN